MNEARLFTVRVWRSADDFRASVRAVGQEQVRLFTAPAPLADYLLLTSFDAPVPPPAPPPAPTARESQCGHRGPP